MRAYSKRTRSVLEAYSRRRNYGGLDMSCWVATSVAAELWGITVKEVLDRIHRGEVNSQTDLGFLVVDVAPHSPKLQPGGGVYIREYSRPSTYREYSRSADI